MPTPSSPHKPEWQVTPRIPKLGYRKALSEEEAEELKSQMKKNAVKNATPVRKQSLTSNTRSATPVTINGASRKKGSFLRGIFAKEPTIMALASFEADVKAKYGATTPQAVPHVSSRRMPEYVPRVNTKWDGVPDAAKQREKEDKKTKLLSQQTASTDVPQTGISRSTNRSVMYSQNSVNRGSTRSSASGSQNGSFDQGEGKSRHPRRSSMQSTYSDDSQLSHSNGRPPASVRSQSPQSPSGTSLPEITCFFPHREDHAGLAKVPQRWQSVNSDNTHYTRSSDASGSDVSHFTRPTTVDTIPEHSTCPLNSPREASPITPAYLSEDASSSIDCWSESVSATGKAAKQRSRIHPVTIDAFLAGEAKPLSLDDDSYENKSDLRLRKYQQSVLHVKSDVAQRSDSSRGRLGLGASMLVANDATPWESQDESPVNSSVPRTTNRTRVPKALALLKR